MVYKYVDGGWSACPYCESLRHVFTAPLSSARDCGANSAPSKLARTTEQTKEQGRNIVVLPVYRCLYVVAGMVAASWGGLRNFYVLMFSLHVYSKG